MKIAMDCYVSIFRKVLPLLLLPTVTYNGRLED
jgi:hypothetical protein